MLGRPGESLAGRWVWCRVFPAEIQNLIRRKALKRGLRPASGGGRKNLVRLKGLGVLLSKKRGSDRATKSTNVT